MGQDGWPAIAVLGAGAVGCYFGGMLARAGAPVILIGRAAHVDAIRADGLLLESSQFRERIAVSASTEVAAARGAQIVLLCVKTLGTVTAATALAQHLAAGAAVISLQNGVDNVERIRAASGIDAVPAVVYVAVAMSAPGHVMHTGRGDLILGDLLGRYPSEPECKRRLESLAALFVRAVIPCRVSENVEGELWVKLVMNCAYNAISAVSRARYLRITSNPWTRALLRQIVDEVIAVAGASNVRLPDIDLIEAVWKLADAMADAVSSTAQDIDRGKHTEIDALNGYIARRGMELGVATPVNQTLHALVKLLEEEQIRD